MDVPGALAAATISGYWIGVGVMIVRVRRHTRTLSSVVPQQPLERMMGLVWIPLVVVWVALPYLALQQRDAPLGLPPWVRDNAWYGVVRWIAALVAVACLAATIKCWARMGKDWRMAVSVGEKQILITDGFFGRIRHPIYAFSILLVLCAIVVVPTVPMLVVGGMHVALWVAKARNEERHLLATLGSDYALHLARTGRFLPRLR